MAAPVRQTNALVGVANHTMHSIDADRLVAGRQAPNEDRWVGGRRPFMANIVG
jgi:hypothetical protein